MPFQLPLELYNEIIKCLWDDRNALSACSLAGRILTVASQKVLFYQIILNPASRDRGSGTSSAFHKLLETSPHIADYVQCLQIFDMGESEEDYDLLDCWLPEDPFLPFVSPLLLNLNAFVLRHVSHWNDLCDQVQHSLRDLIWRPSLVHIDLDAYPWMLLHPFFSTNLKHLIIRNNLPLPAPMLVPSEPSSYSPIYLETLVLERAEQTFLIPFTSDPDSRLKTSHLRILLLEICTDETFQHAGIKPLLHSCRETLEQFTFVPFIVSLSQTNFSTSRSTPVDLSQMTALKTFSLRLYTTTRDTCPLYCFYNLLKSASLTCQQLENVIFVTESRGKGISDMWYWRKSCDFLLNPSRYPRLRKLAIHATEIYGDSQLLAALENSESMERLRARIEVVADAVIFSMEVDLPDERWGNVKFM